MFSLEDFIKQNFKVGSIRFAAESHVTPDGRAKLRLVTIKTGYEDEFECIVVNNVINVIENNYVKDK